MDLKFTFFFPFFLFYIFSYRMERGHKEVLTNQARCRRGTPRETPTTSSLVSTMSIEELRLYSKISTEISPKTLDSATTSIVGEAGNVVYFTWEQFASRLHLPHSIVGEAVPSFHLGTSYTHTSEHFSNFDGLQCTELSLPTGYLVGGDMFCLHFEGWDWGPPVHVGP